MTALVPLRVEGDPLAQLLHTYLDGLRSPNTADTYHHTPGRIEAVATCFLCPADDNGVDDADMLDHLRVMHPDQYGDGPERWPDGQAVVHDMTLAPADFSEGTA